MTTFTTEDREQLEKEPIPFYGFCHLTDSSVEQKRKMDHPVLQKAKIEYRITDASEDTED